MKENWSKKPYPPVEVDVLSRRTLFEGEDYKKEVVYIKGHHVHLGILIKGQTGDETVVVREHYKGNISYRFETDLDYQDQMKRHK